MSAEVTNVVSDKGTEVAEVATAVRKNKYSGMHYYDLLDEATKPIADRRELPIGRGNEKQTLRRFHILQRELDQLKAAARDGDKFPNPHNRGNYYFIWEALKTLGMNRWHDFKDLFREIRRQMSAVETKDSEGQTLWQRYIAKPSRSENGRDVYGKVLQNIEVMQRVTGKSPYGLKVNQVAQEVLGLAGACIDIAHKDVKGEPVYVRLNTRPENFLRITTQSGKKYRVALPLNELKRSRVRGENDSIKVVTVKRKPKAKVARPVEAVVEPVAEVAAEPVAVEAEATAVSN